MDVMTIAIAYVFMCIVTFAAIVEELETGDIIASFVFAAAWPVLIPARILRRIFR